MKNHVLLSEQNHSDEAQALSPWGIPVTITLSQTSVLFYWKQLGCNTRTISDSIYDISLYSETQREAPACDYTYSVCIHIHSVVTLLKCHVGEMKNILVCVDTV